MKRLIVIGTMITTGCATGLTSIQKQELESYRAKGLYVEEKSPGTAAGLGFVFGGGSFYTRNYGLGIVNLLTWPLSILWDPISGTNGAESINYALTRATTEKSRRKEVMDLDDQLASGKITAEKHIQMKREIERKYEP